MTDTQVLQIIIPVTIALLAAIPGSLAYFNNRKKQQLEATTEVVNIAMSFIDPLKNRIDDLESENTKQNEHIDLLENRVNVLESENATLLDGATRLNRQVQSLGGNPVFKIDNNV